MSAGARQNDPSAGTQGQSQGSICKKRLETPAARGAAPGDRVEGRRVLSQFGFDAGTRDFAKFIGLTQPIIYRYFPTKQALIQEVYKVVYLGLWNERWDEILINSRLPLRSRLIGFFDQYTDVIMNSQWLRLYLYAGLRGVEINELYIKLVEEKIIKRIVVEFWKQHGLGRPDIIPSADMETV